jgi:hypothetical protein
MSCDDWQEYWDCLFECDAKKSPRPEKPHKNGGFEPTKANINTFKKVDLITLPTGIIGTNCFNCEYAEDKKDNIAWCKNEKVHLYVTNRQCCALWDNEKVKRAWH